MKRFIPVLTFLIILVFHSSINAQGADINAKVDSVLSLMTLEEKIGQMNQYNGFWEVTGPAPQEGDAALKYENLKKGLAGSVLNVRGVENVREMQRLVVEESRLGIPLIFGSDVIHGYKTLSPIPLGESASWDMEAIERSARMAAIEGSATGINWTFAPMIDISRDARWGRVMEGGGEDPYLGSKIAAARIRGFQGDDLSAHNTIAATAKHFAGYGFPVAGKDYNTVDVGTSTLYNVILSPFRAAVDHDVKTFMNAFNVLNGIPATGDEFLQRDILKGKWGFAGFVVSDWGSVGEMVEHGYARDNKHAAELAANAGSDMDMETYAYIDYLEELVEEGKVKEEIIDDAVRRILKVKFELGLFDDPYRYADQTREDELLYHPDHQEIALDMAKRSIVLLKNKPALLPLDGNQGNIAVIGALADDKNSPLGSWRIGSDDNTAVSVLEGLDSAGISYTYAKGADVAIGETSFITEVNINNSDTTGFAEARDVARDAGVVIMVLGEHGFQSGEGRSRTELGLPGVQQQLLETVYEVNSNIVLVLMNGRPLAIPWADEHIPAILETWHPGTQSGNAIAQVLLGDYNPSGKLPMTFPRSVGQVPIYYNHFNTGRPGPEELVFWSHYIDESNDPLYPFGYGLSYTEFEYSNLEIDASDDSNILVSADITNIGSRPGEEVVQLYIRDRVASVVRPVRELKGFEKIMLEPGESRKVTFTLTDEELGFYDNSGNYITEPGGFDVMVGTNSQEGLTGSFVKK